MEANTSSSRDCEEILTFLKQSLRRVHEDLIEALLRTPVHVSSYAFIQRSLRLVRACLEALLEREVYTAES